MACLFKHLLTPWLAVALLMAVTPHLLAQAADDGFQYMVEPDGWQASIRTRTPTGGNQVQVFHLLYRQVDEQEDGDHDHEEAKGGGIAMGNRVYFSQRPTGIFIGGRLDTLYMRYEWEEDDGDSGDSEVAQIAPWAIAGVGFDMDGFIVELLGGAGYVYNVAISGEDVGSQFTFAAGAALGFRF